MINVDNLEKIAIVTTKDSIYSMYLKEMYIENNGSDYNNKVFVIYWYNETTKEGHTSDWTGEQAYIKYNSTVIDTSFIQYIYDLVSRCVKSYFGNDIISIKNIEYLNNRFILNEVK